MQLLNKSTVYDDEKQYIFYRSNTASQSDLTTSRRKRVSDIITFFKCKVQCTRLIGVQNRSDVAKNCFPTQITTN